jgi:hypothetical protein
MEKEARTVVFTDYKAKNFLKKDLPIAKNVVIIIKEARKISEEKNSELPFGFPFVMKLVSDNIIHKTEIGAVKIVYSKEQFYEVLKDFLKKSDKFKAQGIMLEEFIYGQEVIIGIKKDKTFGHVLAFGLGGIFVEVLKDISFRACPINEHDAESMIDGLKAKKVLFGSRGMKYDINFLKKILIIVSQIPGKNPEIIEMDLNPFILNENGGKVVDARIVFER